jgi:RNA polymerase sigma-70 factor (ECF subfamily)
MSAAMELPPADTPIENVFSSRIERRRPVESSDLAAEVTALFDDLSAPLLRYVASFGLTRHDGEEIIQEVFLSLFLHLREGKSRSNIRGWLFRVAHNLSLKRREKNQRSLRIVSRSDEYSFESHLDVGPDPEERLSAVQRQHRLLAVVDALPENDRRCLYLRAEGLRYREIARVLGVSLGSVALSLARSLSRLTDVDGR